jgi:hypothetical protein
MAEGTRLDACTPRPKRDGGTWWHRVGSAWRTAEGKITVYLDSVPLPDKDGRVAIMLFEPRDEQQQEQPQRGARRPAAGGGGARQRDGLDDDEIPF